MGDGGTADLNVNGAYALGAVSETGLPGFTPTFIGNSPGQVDGFASSILASTTLTDMASPRTPSASKLLTQRGCGLPMRRC